MRLQALTRCLLALAMALSAVASVAAASGEITARGEYLTRAGNCMGCHTARGGAEFAGGKKLNTDFGTFITPNITPDPKTGIGEWTADEFWRALHQGRRADGAPLYPVCPYTSFTRATREDVNAIYAYLRSVPAVEQQNPPHELRLPFSLRSLLNTWQTLFFEPGTFTPDPERGGSWNRGAYLVRGLGHCMTCHAERNLFGAPHEATDIPGNHVQGWYAPSLYSSAEAGLQRRSLNHGAELLGAGRADEASTMGPMADVVYESLQHLTPDDLRAIAGYLRSLPDHEMEPRRRGPAVTGERREQLITRGRTLYGNRCMDCHGADGQGSEVASALAGNRAVVMDDPTNLINIIRRGGYPPATAGNPRPFGMPPFQDLDDTDLAALATFIRTSWGNAGSPVSAVTVERTQ